MKAILVAAACILGYTALFLTVVKIRIEKHRRESIDRRRARCTPTTEPIKVTRVKARGSSNIRAVWTGP